MTQTYCIIFFNSLIVILEFSNVGDRKRINFRVSLKNNVYIGNIRI